MAVVADAGVVAGACVDTCPVVPCAGTVVVAGAVPNVGFTPEAAGRVVLVPSFKNSVTKAVARPAPNAVPTSTHGD